jgi:hypothetical protein
VGFDTLYKKVEQQVTSTTGPIKFKISDLDVLVDHNHAYSRYISELNGTLTAGKPFFFVTRVLGDAAQTTQHVVGFVAPLGNLSVTVTQCERTVSQLQVANRFAYLEPIRR